MNRRVILLGARAVNAAKHPNDGGGRLVLLHALGQRALPAGASNGSACEDGYGATKGTSASVADIAE